MPENTTLLRLIETRDDSTCPEHRKAFDFYCLTDLVNLKDRNLLSLRTFRGTQIAQISRNKESAFNDKKTD